MNPTPALDLTRDWLQAIIARSADTEEVLAEFRDVLVADDRLFCKLEDTHDLLRCDASRGGASRTEVAAVWGLACERMAAYLEAFDEIRNKPHGRIRTLFLRAFGTRSERLAGFMRTMVLTWQEYELNAPPELYEAVWAVRISSVAYLRAMWNLFWSAIRHPRSETTIDLSTGRVLYRT